MLHALPATMERTPLLDTAALRLLEGQMSASLPTGALMERAGLAAARLARARWPDARRVRLLCGPGNNGGDGLVMARHLHQQGLDVRALQVHSGSKVPGERQLAEQRALQAGVPMTNQLELSDAELVVDALLGIGLRAAPRGPLHHALRTMAEHPSPRMALDLPSGLDADEGHDWGAVPCQATLSYLAAKPGLWTGAGRSLCGELWLDDLGASLSHTRFTVMQACAWAAGQTSDWHQWSPRSNDPAGVHKGRVGQVWVASGTSTMGGAARLAGRAALASGAGRVYLAGAETLDAGPPELMSSSLQTALEALKACPTSCAVVGCGGGDAVTTNLPDWLAASGQMVLDADGLNAVARDRKLGDALRQRATRGQRSVITPHPLEAARLLELPGASVVQEARLRHAQALAERYACCVVLKGSGTVVAAPGAKPVICTRGHAALASAGTGDVLAGWLGGLLTQAPQAPLQEVTALACAWHGAAAEGWPRGGGPARASALIEAMASIHP